MWKSKSSWNRGRGSFTNRRQGRQFGSRGEHKRENRSRDGNRSLYESRSQADRNFQQDSRSYGLDEDRYGGSEVHVGIEIGDAYNRDRHQDISTAGLHVSEDFDDDSLYRDHDHDRRYAEPSLGHYDDINARHHDSYWDDQQVQSYDHRDQELRNNDYHVGRDQRRFDNDDLNRFDRDFQNDGSLFRNEELNHDRQGSYRERVSASQDDFTRNQHEHNAKFGVDNRRGYDSRVSRQSRKDEKLGDSRMSFNRKVTDHRQDSRSKHGARPDAKFHSSNVHAIDREHGNKKQDSVKAGHRTGKRLSEHKSSTSSEAKGKTGNIREQNNVKSGGNKFKRYSNEKTKSELKIDKKPSLTAVKTPGKDEHMQKMNKSIPKSTERKHSSVKRDFSLKQKQSSNSDKRRDDPKNQRSSHSTDEKSSFKKPVEKPHQHRQRSNSGRKIESDVAKVHEEDILSIMADDDGFERETRIYSKSSANRSLSRKSGSRERGTNVSDSGRRSSRDSERRDRNQHKDKSSKQDVTTEFDTRTIDVHVHASGSTFGKSSENVKRSPELSSTLRSDTRRNQQTAFNTRYKRFGDKDFNRQSGSNNNYVGGRSRLSFASKIKDSYFKRRQTFHRIGYRGDNSRPSYKSVNVHNEGHSLQKEKHGKNEISKSGAVLKDDRFRENKSSSNLNNRDRSRLSDNRSKGIHFDRNAKRNNSERNSRSYSFKQNFDRNSLRNKFQRDRATYSSRGLASERVKRKYFKGGFGQYGSNARHDMGKDYKRDKGEKSRHWKKMPVGDENVYAEKHHQMNLCDNDQQLEDQSLDSAQPQVIFIPNTDMQTGQHMINQFGQIIVNPDDMQQNEAQVPVQYLPQQFHHDGEQVLFIPFVNNQTTTGYSENEPLSNSENLNFINDSEVLEVSQVHNTTSLDTKQKNPGKKPLSKQAREKMRKLLALKRKQRLEKQIEKKVLRKLLKNPDISKVVKETEFNEMKKKHFIKRISPPGPSSQSHGYETLNVIRQEKIKDEFEDVSEDEKRYDNFNDLEDISDYEYMSDGNDDHQSRQLKRPVFRKPGQSRIKKTMDDSSRNMSPGTSGDIRKVVNQNSSQVDNRNIQKGYGLQEKRRLNDNHHRSVFVEDSFENIGSLNSQKRGNEIYENKSGKKRRSISPIEITVSNDHYSKTASRSSKFEDTSMHDYDYDERTTGANRSSGRLEERGSDFIGRNSDERRLDGRVDRRRNDRRNEFKKVVDETQYGFKEKEKKGVVEKGNDPSHRSNFCDRSGKRYAKTERSNYSGYETEEKRRMGPTSPRFRNREQSSAGKYDSIDLTADEKSRSYSKTEDGRSKMERSFKSHERGDTREGRRDARYFDRKANETSSHELNTDIEEQEYSRSDTGNRSKDRIEEESRNEGKRVTGRDLNIIESRNETRNIQLHERHRNNPPEDGTRRNITSNTFVSSMNQGQFQINQPLMQQSVQPQTFLSVQSQAVPLQFSNSGSIVDHSLPPVQNSPMSIPPMPPPGLSIRPDMSLPPPLMNVMGTPTSVVIQQPSNLQYQQQSMQQVGMQQQTMQQQQFQNMQPQFQQQQQFQQQPQMVQQQHGAQQFQSQQPMFQNNLQSSPQMSLQQMHSGQFQQNQNVGMVQVNRNMMQGQVSRGTGQGLGAGQQVIKPSMNKTSYVPGTPEQAVRGTRVRITSQGNQVSSSPTNPRRSMTGHGRSISTNYQVEDEDEYDDDDDDDFAEMLCSKCDKVFLSHEVMRRHGRWHEMIENNTKSWRCDQCEQGFTVASAHAEHKSSKHHRDSWNCSLCDMTFNTSTALNRHVRHPSHKGLKVKFICSLCPASFMVLMHLVQHKKENHQSHMGYSELRKY